MRLKGITLAKVTFMGEIKFGVLLILSFINILAIASLSSCIKPDDNFGNKSEAEIIWVKDQNENMKYYGYSWGNLDVVDNSLFISTYRNDDYSPVLVKFDKSNGEHIATWDEGGNGGLKYVTRYYWNNYLIFIRREEYLTAIDLNTMTLAWELGFEESLSMNFVHFENKVFLTANGQSQRLIYEVNLNNQKRHVINPTNGNFLPVSISNPYVTEQGDTSIFMINRTYDDCRLIKYNLSKDSSQYEIKLTEFTDFENQISNINIIDNQIFIYNFYLLSSRDFYTGKLLWKHDIAAHPNTLYFADGKYFYTLRESVFSGNILYCREAKTNYILWSLDLSEYDIYWGGSSIKLIDNLLFLDNIPINVESGLPITSWLKRNDVHELILPFKGIPSEDIENGNLYFETGRKIYYVKMP